MKAITKTIAVVSICAGTLAFGALAQAKPMVTLEFPAAPALFPQGYKATQITYNNNVTSKTSYVAAGMFGGTATGSNDFDATTLYSSENNVLAYCIDIMNNLLSDGTYNVQAIGQNQVDNSTDVRRDFARTLSFLGAVNEVLTPILLLSDTHTNWLNPNSAWMSAAIQVGIWESLYESDGAVLSTSDGWFEATTLGTQGDEFLTAAFGMMSTAAALDARKVKWLQIENGQDLIVDPVTVPTPATLGLFALGLAGLGWSRRKKA